MLNKTHIVIGVFFMLFFLQKVTHVWAYVFVFAVATLLPNVDRGIFFGRFINQRKSIRPRNRGLLHSFTFCLTITVMLAWFLPIMAFPFFLAYGTHLIVDSWTTDGIKPFWPLRYVAKGSVKQGGSLENIIFYSFVFADFIFVLLIFL